MVERGWNRPVRGQIVPNIVYVPEIYGWNDSMVVRPEIWLRTSAGMGSEWSVSLSWIPKPTTIISFSVLFSSL